MLVSCRNESLRWDVSFSSCSNRNPFHHAGARCPYRANALGSYRTGHLRSYACCSRHASACCSCPPSACCSCPPSACCSYSASAVVPIVLVIPIEPMHSVPIVLVFTFLSCLCSALLLRRCLPTPDSLPRSDN